MRVIRKIVKLAISIIGTGLIALSVIWLFPNIKELSWKRISATVIATTVYSLDMGIQETTKVQDAEVRYSYVVNGSKLTGRGTYHYPEPTTLSSVADMKTIEIRYNPAKPGESIIKRPVPPVAALLGLLGIVCVIVAFTMVVLSRRHSPKSRKRAR